MASAIALKNEGQDPKFSDPMLGDEAIVPHRPFTEEQKSLAQFSNKYQDASNTYYDAPAIPVQPFETKKPAAR